MKAAELEGRRAQVAELLLARRSIRQIASVLDVPRSTVHRDALAVRTEWQRRRLDAIEHEVASEIVRLDAMERALWPKVLACDLQAFDRQLRIMERRAKLLGLDAPKRIDVETRIRDMAREGGVDPDEAVRWAMAIVKETQA